MIANQISATAPYTLGERTPFLPALEKSRQKPVSALTGSPRETSKCAYAAPSDSEKRVSALTISLCYDALKMALERHKCLSRINPPCSPD